MPLDDHPIGSRMRLGCALAGAVVLALGALGPASAHSHGASKYGGTLVTALSGTVSVTDPTVGGSISVYLVMCERLYGLDAGLHLRPLLAATVPALSKD